MLRHAKWLIALVLFATLGGGYFYTTTTATTQTAVTTTENELQTATVRRGDLIVSATGAGTIISPAEIELSFASSGILVEKLVNVGDKVQAGDVLARLDDSSAQEALLNAQLQLAQATLQTDGSQTATGVSFNEIAVLQAQMNLEQAQASLDELLNWQPDPNTIAQAEAQLAAAQASYNAALGQESASSSNVQVNKINLEAAQRNLATAEANYTAVFDTARDWELNDPRFATKLTNERAAAERSLQNAKDSLAIAQAQYNASAFNTNSSSSTNAESNILAAQIALQNAQTGPTEDEIYTAQVVVDQAELALKQAQLNQEAAQLSWQQAQLNLLQAQEAVTGTQLTAPAAGTVLAVTYDVGETVNGSLITLADLSTPMLELFIDQTDLDKIGVGYEVEVTFDALPDELFTGQITQIDPQLFTSGGVAYVRAIVTLNYNKPQTLPIGLNATVDVIGGRATNTLLVPVEAVREINPGEYALFVMVDGEPQLRFVEVGLMDFSFAQILSGVEEGDVVTTGLVETE